jgi:ABC-type dipeptide/oligopeptide/nickel transport system ATPase component
MRIAAGPRWLGALILSVVLVGVVALTARLAGPGVALLLPLSARLPLATAGTIASPILSGLLGVGGGLLAARHSRWISQRLRALVLAGCVVCVVWMALVCMFWFAVQGELMNLLALDESERAGVSALSTLLLPSTAIVFGAAAMIAVRVRAATRIVAFEGHVQTAQSQGRRTIPLVIRRVVERTLPVILTVLIIEFLTLYGGSLTVQAVFGTPSLVADLPPLLPAESLPYVLGATLFCIIGLIAAVVARAGTVSGPASSPLPLPAAPARRQTGAVTGTRSGSSPLPSTRFRSADLLDIRDLRVHSGARPAGSDSAAGINLTVARGEALAIVGGDDDGASLLSLAIAGLLPPRSAISSGSILFDGTELVGLPERQFRALRGRRIGFLSASGTHRLDPGVRIGHHLARLATSRPGSTRASARADALSILSGVGIGDAATVFSAHPHQLSAATTQRVLLAGALVLAPQLLVADNPTGCLETADEACFLDVLHALQRAHGFALIMASAKPANVARCDRVAVMRNGTIVEYAAADELLTNPQHPHSRRLLANDSQTAATGPRVER